MNFEIANRHVNFQINDRGQTVCFMDKAGGVNYALPWAPVAWIKKSGREFAASAAEWSGHKLTLYFGDSGANAQVAFHAKDTYFIAEVVALSCPEIEECIFIDVLLKVKGSPDDPFAGCALALNGRTNVYELPGANSRLRAVCYARFGVQGAQAAVIGAPFCELRKIIRTAVNEAPELPHSPVGGPWALDVPANRGSYLLGTVSETNVEVWIDLLKAFGIHQFDFHGGKHFRFGDFRLDPEDFPHGRDGLRQAIAKFHAAGILAGLHTYSFFIDKRCPWVTPVPDERLAKDITLTLAEPVAAETATIPVEESPGSISTVHGFFVRNSVILQIDDELLEYGDVQKEPPYGFSKCRRGAFGTRAAPHRRGAKVHHLRQCFNLLVPDGESSLLTEVAALTADMYNDCGFDMIYLDALDGEDAIGGMQNGWHYGTKFVFELFNRLKKPAIMEMSTFRHHLWYVRSRHGAWDAAARNHKHFIDLHAATNADCRRIFMPTQLGWWQLGSPQSIQSEPMFPDVVEYLCAKSLAADSGLSFSGLTPALYNENPYVRRLAEIIRKYETLRLSGKVPAALKEQLQEPGAEFHLEMKDLNDWKFRRIERAVHKVEGTDSRSRAWQIRNEYGEQPLKIRIDALMSVTAYDHPDNLVLADFQQPSEFSEIKSSAGILAELRLSREQVKTGSFSGCYYTWKRTGGSYFGWRDGERCGKAERPPDTFSSIDHGARDAAPVELAWARAIKKFSPFLNLGEDLTSGGEPQGIGAWIYGDGRGETLNFQLKSSEIQTSWGDHYAVIDFTGWRYFEFVEHEGTRVDDYAWPYSRWIYNIFGWTYHPQIESLNLWYNNLPLDGKARCYLSPIKALRLIKNRLINPTITLGGVTLVFPVELESGCYLEFNSPADCKYYDYAGNLLGEIKPQGKAPKLAPGLNRLEFSGKAKELFAPRARVTIVAEGNLL